MTGDRWNSWPTHRSQEFLEDIFDRHDNVRSWEKLAPNRYDVKLKGGQSVKIFVTDVYEFTVSNYAELRGKYPEVNCIAQASTWNHFTEAAREAARDEDIATFHFKGLMGALNYTGDEFLDYPDIQY